MAEESFPIVDKPMSAAQWRSVTLGIGSGVLDEGGAPYRLVNVSNANNTVTVAVDSITGYAHAILHGFYHKIDANVTLSVPAVTAKTTYYVALQYDPERTAPVVLDVFTSLDRSGGKDYLVLHEIVRNPNQLLTDAARTKVDTKVTPTVTVDTYDALPDPGSVLYSTLAVVRLPSEKIYQSRGTTDRRWDLLIDSEATLPFQWNDRGSTSSYVSPVAGGHVRSLGRRGRERVLRGRVALASGNSFQPGSPYQPFSGTLDPGDRPSRVETFTCGVNGAANLGFARVEISPDGTLVAYVSKPATWIDFAGIRWEVSA